MATVASGQSRVDVTPAGGGVPRHAGRRGVPTVGRAGCVGLRLLAPLLLLLLAGVSMGQECTVEVEPNEQPGQAPTFSTAACFTGVLESGDQDSFFWEVSEEDAGFPWTFTIEGIPDQLTKVELVRITFADNGVDVTAADRLWEMGTYNGRPVTSGEFLLGPGRYLVGISKSGGEGRWVLSLDQGRELTRDFEEMGSEVEGSGELAFTGVVEGQAEVAWQVSEEDAGYRWGLEVRTSFISRPELMLEGPDGTVVSGRADENGRLLLGGIGLEAGEYRLILEGDDEVVPFTLSAIRQGLLTDGNEIEPNDGIADANVLELDAELQGVTGNDDYYAINIGEEMAGRTWDLLVDSEVEVTAAIYSADEELLLQRRGWGGTLHDLVFEEGTYYLQIASRDQGNYTLRFEEGATPREGFEREPNDTLAGAFRLEGEIEVRGEFGGRDLDVFEFEVAGEPQLWRIQVLGDGVDRLRYINGGGVEQQELSGERRIRMDNVLLLPGRHYLEVRGEGGEYALRAIALGRAPEPEPVVAETSPADESDPDRSEGEPAATSAPSAKSRPTEPSSDPGAPETAGTATDAEDEGPDLSDAPPGRMELEPNDDTSRAELLRFGETRVGTFSQENDRDYYRFFMANDGYVRFTLVPPEGATARLDVSGPGHLLTSDAILQSTDRWLSAGDYFIDLRNVDWAPGFYTLELTHLDPFALPVDFEPNDRWGDARPVPESLSWEGQVGERGQRDWDYFRIPAFELETELTVRVESNDELNYNLRDADGNNIRIPEAEEGSWRVTLPPGGPFALGFSGRSRYRAQLELSNRPDPAALHPEPAEDLGAELALDTNEITAYWHAGQRVEGRLEIHNRSEQQREIELFATASSVDVQVELPGFVTVPPGESVSVPVEVVALPDVRGDQPVRISVAAAADGTLATSGALLDAVCEAVPVSPEPMWRTPEAMLGHLNLLWSAFDVSFDEEEGSRVADLFDGRTAPSTGFSSRAGNVVTVALPGGEPVELLGTMLNPQSRGGTGQQLRDFEVEVSLDGEEYTTVFAGSLKSARVEQSFLFDEQVRARYARLRLGPNQDSEDVIYLGEWKLIAAEEAPFGPLNIALPELGGHVVSSSPLLRNRGASLLDESEEAYGVAMRNANTFEWVIGFHHARAAQITRLEWQEASEVKADEVIDEVTVEASMQGGAGPWEPIASWDLQRDASGLATLELPEPTWARYLRFSTTVPEEATALMPPGRLRIFEREAGTDYLSIVGQWDHNRKDSWLERQSQGEPFVGFEADDNDSMENAQALSSGDGLRGTVEVGRDEDWYRISVEEGSNEIVVQLQGDPSIAYLYELVDDEGKPIYYDARPLGEGVELRAWVEPGEYYLKLEEPKRSVIFSWDTSGSVSPYQPITYNSLARFARDLDPEREATQLLAFDNPSPIWLLSYWSEDPLRVQTAINDFDRRADSSNSEAALLKATTALGDRDGTRAVLFMTDAETGGYDLTSDLWQELGEVRPRVFTFEISTAGSDWTQDLMQDWASVNGGYYDYTRNIGDFDIGFDRASCHLRRPKGYTVSLDVRQSEPPGPGELSVKRGEEMAFPAVEVIFDASGSMGSRLESGEQKIEVAKQVLEELVTDILPEGTPFAFRAFGHIEPSSCETRLDVPLAPLDAGVAAQAIAAIEPKLLSQTPIADSLLAVPQDLASAGEGSTVILITDGEESCDGDPRAALEQLREEGIDVQLSVVSLGIDDEAVREQFSHLAELGGGTYVDARDAQVLRDSVEAALYPTFQVLDLKGEVIASGRVDGEPVELEMGVYRVRLPNGELREVRVPGDRLVTVRMAGP